MHRKLTEVVITGSHSVGKTTLCEALRTSLNGKYEVDFNYEIARVLIERGIAMNYSVTEFGIVSYLLEYFSQRRDQSAPIVISDRSVFDLYVYITASRPPDVREEFVRLAEEIVRLEVTRGCIYVYVPIEFPMIVDDVRPSDIEYQKEIDETVERLLDELGATTITVSGSVENRVESVLKAFE